MHVTMVQFDASASDASQALERLNPLLNDAAPTDLVMLPELWRTGFFQFDRYADQAEPLDGPTVQALADHARRLGCHLFMGSFVERRDGRLYNTSVLIGPDGSTLGAYRKIHLFGYQSRERQLLDAGREVTVVDTAMGRVGLCTCYDLRFPELFRRMVDLGAQMFLVTSAWPAARVDAWRLFARARAHENLAFLLACNGCGPSNGTPLAGHSVAVDPMGVVLCEADDQPAVLTCEIDLAQVTDVRSRFPALDDRVIPVSSAFESD